MSQKAITGLILSLAVLLTVVIGIGLLRDSIDTTSVALALITGMSGIVTGAVFRKATSAKKDDGGGDEE